MTMFNPVIFKERNPTNIPPWFCIIANDNYPSFYISVKSLKFSIACYQAISHSLSKEAEG